MGLSNILKKGRIQFSKQTTGTNEYKYFSANIYSLYSNIYLLINKYFKGKVLDIGAGDLNYMNIVIKNGCEYVSLDLDKTKPVDFIGSVEDLSLFEPNSFDGILCVQVFEYVKQPNLALNEINKVLKSGGHLIISFPFLSPIHDQPYDLFRYSADGMKYLLSKNGFKIINHYNLGGIFEFLTHNISFVFVTLFWNIPLLNKVILYLNLLLIVFPTILFDKLFGLNTRFPTNVIIVAQKI